jgi:energy-coupling factor transport system permease protein
MRGIEFFRNISVGQYVDSGSYVHRLTPATKYLGSFALLLAVFANTTIVGTATILVLVALIAVISRVSLGFLARGIIPAWPFLLILTVMTLVFQSFRDSSAVLVTIGPLDIRLGALSAIALLLLRFAAVVCIVSLFTSVVSEDEVAHGAEDALSPLKAIGFPAHEFSLMIVIALRFVPIIALELENITKAQASRGASFGSGRGGPIAKARAYIPIFVPVIIRALERAELLVEAMEARCYVGEGRTRYAVYEKAKGETAVRIGIAVFSVLSVAFGVFVR